MFGRYCLGALGLTCLVLSITGCTNSQVGGIAVSPTTQSLSVGQTARLTATGIIGHGSDHAPSYQDETSSVTWSSSSPEIATVGTSGSTAGLVTSMQIGTTTITASMAGATSAAATITVTAAVAGSGSEPLLSIAIVPGTLTTDNLYGTGQFLAYGTFSTEPTLQDVTNGFYHAGFPDASCTAAAAAADAAAAVSNSTPPDASCSLVSTSWISAMPSIFAVNSSGATGATAGLVTANGSGTAYIYATVANPDGTLVLSSDAAFNCPLKLPTVDSSGVMTDPGTCNYYTIAPALTATLTVYNAGLNTTGWLVTAPSATGTQDVIQCGPGSGSGGSVCTATYPVGTTVTLTAPAETGVAFGGWSSNCTPNPLTPSAVGPNTCTVTLGVCNKATGFCTSSNKSVGAIFNNAN